MLQLDKQQNVNLRAFMKIIGTNNCSLQYYKCPVSAYLNAYMYLIRYQHLTTYSEDYIALHRGRSLT